MKDFLNNHYHYCFGRYKKVTTDLPDFVNIEQRFKHLYMIGKSGMGKSTIMENLAHYDISQGYSVIFIDPKGESADKLYYHFRDNQKVRYVSFDNPIIVNLLDKKGFRLDNLIDEFVQILDKVISITTPNPESTTRMQEIIYYALTTLNPEDRNFKNLYEFLNSKEKRNAYVSANAESKQWWDDLFDHKKTEYKKKNEYEVTMSSVASRIHEAIRRPETNAFINGDNELDIEQLINNGESLVINIGSSNEFIKVFLANIIVGAILSYLNIRKKNKPLFIYADEFDLVASSFFSRTIQTCRSSFVGWVLAHQAFSSANSEAHRKMMQGVIQSILAAVSNYCVFNTSPVVAREMSDTYNLTMTDFTNLNKYEAQLRLGTNNITIYTKIPVLQAVPDDYEFPKKSMNIPASINFLNKDWIVI